MTLHTYSNPVAFLADVQGTLETNEVVNSLMLGVALRAGQQPYTATPYCAAIHSGGTIAVAALMTPPYNLQIAGDVEENREALELIARNIQESQIAVPGVAARTAVATAFAEIYASLHDADVFEAMNMRLYQLDTVVPLPQPPGTFRVATEADTDILTRWSEEFVREATPETPARNMQAFVEHKIADKELFIWNNERPVSMAARARPTRNVCTVNFVYTPAEFRAHGYASACTAALSQHLLDSGYKSCVLFTDLANPTSNSIYQRIGFRPVCDFTEYRFRSKS